MGEYDLSYYDKEAKELALEIERKLAILEIDWRDETDMRNLAVNVMNKQSEMPGVVDVYRATAWVELCGLIGLMNVLMAESAARDVEVHGNDAWKAIARALWSERGLADKDAAAD